MFRPTTSTPLDDASSETIPKVLLWAMKDHRRSRNHRGDPVDGQVIGQGDDALYVIDAGAPRATLGRIVGSSPDGCVYCLVAVVDAARCADLTGDATSRTVLARATELILCAVYDGGEGVSNVSDVRHFDRVDDVPDEYLPPHPFVEFTEVL